MMIKKLAPSPRDMVSSPRSSSTSHHHRSSTVVRGDGALSPRSEGTTATTTVQKGGTTTFSRNGGEKQKQQRRPLSPEINTQTVREKVKTSSHISPRSNGPTFTKNKEDVKIMTVPTSSPKAKSATTAVESPTAVTSTTIDQAPTILTEAPPPVRLRSKRMLVVDPKSGRKYDLQEDDHSLTDKELHVYHRGHTVAASVVVDDDDAALHGGTKSAPTSPIHSRNNNNGSLFGKNMTTMTTTTSPTTRKTNAVVVPSSSPSPAAVGMQHDTQTFNSTALQLMMMMNDDVHTLETASALTEVSYYNNINHGSNNNNTYYFGALGEGCGGGGERQYKSLLSSSSPFDCMLPTSCSSVRELALEGGLATEGIIGKRKKEGRDDVESMEKGRYKHHVLEDQLQKTKKTGTLSPYDDYQQQQLHYQQQQAQFNKTNNNNHSQPSPITAALSAIIDSPRMLFSEFFGNNSPNGNNNHRNKSAEEHQLIHPLASPTTTTSPGGGGVVVHHSPLSFRRVVCMVVFPQEVRSTLDGHTMGLLGMKFVQSGHDFQAHVRWVARGSKAEQMGVRRGDIVSFAVALSNMTEEQNCFLAEKLIKRLESVGMRTSYRELHDIFLSKTTNARPIGMVFRRWKNRGGGGGSSPNNRPTMMGSPLPSSNICITNEFEWSTDFLQCLSIKCREYEFHLKVPPSKNASFTGAGDVMRGESVVNKLQSFLHRPNVETTLSNNGSFSDFVTYLMDNLSIGYDGVQSSSLMKCMDSSLSLRTSAKSASKDLTRQEKNDFLSNRILCSLVEQSMGLIFLRRLSMTKNNVDRGAVGSGFALMRKADGSWSAPCFLSILRSKDEFTDCDDDKTSSSLSDDVKMIIIHKKDLVNSLIGGTAVKFSVRKDERAHVLVRDAAVVGVQEGRFQLTTDFFLTVKVNDVQNQGAYNLPSSGHLSSDQITAFDILTGTVSPPDQSVDFYGALQSLELPYSMHSHPVVPDILQRYSDSDWVEFLPDNGSFASSCGMRTKLEMIAQRNSSPDDMLELDIFARKFKYYLMDGVPVHRVISSSSGKGTTEEKVLRLTIRDPNCIFTSSLELTRRLLPGVSNVGVPSNFSTTLESITKMSRTPPSSMTGLDDDDRNRFFSIETDLSPGPIIMLAKCKKDVMILLCGLKLLLEMERMAQG